MWQKIFATSIERKHLDIIFTQIIRKGKNLATHKP